jgi:outer membrane lipoprotein SlyB
MRFFTLTLAVLLASLAASGDTLRLKNGAVIEGTFLGGDARTIRFLGPDGTPKQHPITDVAAIEFGGTAAPAASAASAPSAAPATARATIPAGTLISVRLIDSIDAKQTAVGTRYRCSVDDPVVVNSQTIVPRGADCNVQVARAETGGRLTGSDELELKLYNITVNGKSYDVASESAELKTEGEGRKTARTTAATTGLGAVIGGLAGGGRGAAIGAVAGAGAGVAASSVKGPHLQVPSETRLTFRLREALPIT